MIGLPNEISELKALHTLHLRNNRMTSFPFPILNLHHLKILYLDENQIERIPKEISQLKLEALDIQANLIGDMEPICQIPSLKTLHIAKCRITVIPSSIRNLKNLRVLYLDHNLIQTIPDEIGDLNLLRIFTCHFNPIVSISTKILNLKHLNHIEIIEGSQIQQIPKEIQLFIKSINQEERTI